jgi:hypothetical protein
MFLYGTLTTPVVSALKKTFLFLFGAMMGLLKSRVRSFGGLLKWLLDPGGGFRNITEIFNGLCAMSGTRAHLVATVV